MNHPQGSAQKVLSGFARALKLGDALSPQKKQHYLSLLNGIIGDMLHSKKNEWAVPMTILGKPTGSKICILLHGLCDSEDTWTFTDDPALDYGKLLKRELGYTPLYLRYNSGLHISTNGQNLALQLEQCLKNHSSQVREIIFIGHSMGGLVARSACHYGRKHGAKWVSKVQKMFFLGTPHFGSDLEKLGHLTSVILNAIPNFVTRGIAYLGNKRSSGIKDLRFGYLLDEDWSHQNPEPLWWDNRHHVPLMSGVDYFLISASLAKKEHILWDYVGDGLVPTRSASGRSFIKSKALPFLPEHTAHFRGISHSALAHHRDVYEKIREWCQLRKRRVKTKQSSRT